jgi:hypothetical protein
LDAIDKEVQVSSPSLSGSVASLVSITDEANGIQFQYLNSFIQTLKDYLDILFFFERAVMRAAGNGDVIME